MLLLEDTGTRQKVGQATLALLALLHKATLSRQKVGQGSNLDETFGLGVLTAQTFIGTHDLIVMISILIVAEFT